MTLYLKQSAWIFGFTLLGEALHRLLPLPIPAAVYGLVLLFLALSLKILKPRQVADVAQFLIRVMGVFFVSPVVNILACWGVVAPNLGAICVIFISTTVLVFAVSGFVTRALLRKEDPNE